MRKSRTSSQFMWEFRRQEKPRLQHFFIGLTVSAFSYALLLLNFRHLLIDIVTQVLSTGQISVTTSFTSGAPQIFVRLSDGSGLNLALTWQRSGLVSILIFGLLYLFLLFPFRGSIWLKIAWLEFGFITGLTWSFIRLSTVVLVAYHFGGGALTTAEFFVGPFTDFLWMISVWSLALSTLVSTKYGESE